MNLLWIYCLIREFTINSLSVSRIHNLFHYVSTSIIYFANLTWIYFLFLKFTLKILSFFQSHFQSDFALTNSLSVWQIHYEFTWCFAVHNEFTIFIANLLWILLMFRKYTEFTMFVAISLSNRELTMNSLSFLRINYEFTWCYANIL